MCETQNKEKKLKNLNQLNFIDVFTISMVIYHGQQHLCR